MPRQFLVYDVARQRDADPGAPANDGFRDDDGAAPPPPAAADLPRADLSGMDLSGIDVSGVDVSGVDLSGADDLDERIIALLVRRSLQARSEQAARRAAGVPARVLAAEQEMVSRYVSGLGRRGGEIAVALLALAQAGGPQLGN